MESKMVTQVDAYKDLTEFTRNMVKVLDKKSEKYGEFTQYFPEDFISHLQDEVEELMEAIISGDFTIGQMEAIDVANMAFMIWWVCKNKN